MIELIEARCEANFTSKLTFSDGTEGIFDGAALLKKNGPLLDALRTEAFFNRAFIDAGALCWPNGLELSPTRLREVCSAVEPV
jgi:hypothetical protein